MFFCFFFNIRDKRHLHRTLCLQNYFTSIEKYLYKKSVRKKESVAPCILFFVCISSACRGRCCRLENPHRSRRASRSVRETGRESTWCPCSEMRRCLPLVYRLSHSMLGLLRVERLAIHVYPNISGTYVHNLQRTTSTAFCRFSCGLCARCLPHGAHRYPKDEQRRQ